MQQIATWATRRRYGAATGLVLLPLRLFLGVTFAFAGLQKLSDPNFFDGQAPSGVHQQLLAASQRSPIGGLLHGVSGVSTPLGVLIALAELAIGVGTLLGLWTRLAALGGVVVSVGFLLAVSWHTHPYYLGSDIVFAVAWVPILIAGAPDRFSFDSRIQRRAREQTRLPPGGPVEIEFEVVRKLCGSYSKGRCKQLGGKPCEPTPCPVLAIRTRLRPEVAQQLDRREFLAAARAVGIAAGAGAVVAAGTAVIGRSLHGPVRRTAAPSRLGGGTPASTANPTAPTQSTAAPSTSTTPRPPGTPIGPAASVPVGHAATFADPATGRPAYVVQAVPGQFRCFSAVCTHAGCTVDYDGSRFVCPCHGAEFDGTTGAVLQGPANLPLSTIAIAEGGDGQLYVQS